MKVILIKSRNTGIVWGRDTVFFQTRKLTCAQEPAILHGLSHAWGQNYKNYSLVKINYLSNFNPECRCCTITSG